MRKAAAARATIPTTIQVMGLARRAAVKAQVAPMAPPSPASRGAKKAAEPARANCSRAKGPRTAATASARPPKTRRATATMPNRMPTARITPGWAWAKLDRRSAMPFTASAAALMSGRNSLPAAIAAFRRPSFAWSMEPLAPDMRFWNSVAMEPAVFWLSATASRLVRSTSSCDSIGAMAPTDSDPNSWVRIEA
ncbi:hypothetical protein D3C77_459630 [compost metagenome]